MVRLNSNTGSGYLGQRGRSDCLLAEQSGLYSMCQDEKSRNDQARELIGLQTGYSPHIQILSGVQVFIQGAPAVRRPFCPLVLKTSASSRIMAIPRLLVGERSDGWLCDSEVTMGGTGVENQEGGEAV
jgi:hypothetical protein